METLLRTPALSSTLDASERSRLAELEPIIQRGLTSFVEVGTALLEISDKRLYRQTHSSFEDYCQDRWSMTARRAYQLCEAAELVKTLPGNANNCSHPVITNEGQARALAAVPPEDRAEVLEAASRTGKLTARGIRAARATINIESSVTPGATTDKPCPPPPWEQIVGLRPDLAESFGNAGRNFGGEVEDIIAEALSEGSLDQLKSLRLACQGGLRRIAEAGGAE